MKRLLLTALIFGLAGFASAPTAEEMAKFDYGSYPADYQDVIKSYMQQRLKDPESAQYRWERGPSQGWDRWGGLKVGWRVCILVNAKNSFGGYTGFQPYYFILNRGQVVKAEAGDSDVARAMVQGACKNV